jgi:peroxiredoxin
MFVEPGQQLPQIALPHLSGGDVSLSTYRGKQLLLFMWASW